MYSSTEDLLNRTDQWDTTNLQSATNAQRPNSTGLKRKFISYKSSKLEQLWLDNVDEWQQTKQIYVMP